ncbi:hypothetical protein [Pseudobacteriovorax antillogorgiicola]|uniref:Uncharacterized protein n=1 Tax=Pseudobacteriovorax antillogorgiicola TaxID=1513793 RepID=A0A1Y6BP36_9BACT|nr:hypothetical protein [Pseudobacteriovorax antillogorgiicola]TCS54591.1 hypothetical protein EDD56_106104 [Pseudobacteriovorax antillogorgiicola]SMF17746.1 hypothetical protein SAMN06296036_106139 [Pseudobacteriovorax antillogorgiicola]
MQILSHDQVEELWSEIKDGRHYKIVALPQSSEEKESDLKFQHDLRGALRTFRFIAQKAIPDDENAVNQKKRAMVDQYIKDLQALLAFYEALGDDS